MPLESTPTVRPFVIEKARTRLLGLSLDECIHAFFGGNAFMAVVVLALITVFLFREGADFFGQNRSNLRIYRQAGLEYVDYMRQQEKDHTALTRYLFDVRMRTVKYLTEIKGLTAVQANAQLAAFDNFSGRYEDTVEPIRGMVSDLTEVATAIKTKFTVNGKHAG